MITYTTLAICSVCAFLMGYLLAEILVGCRYQKRFKVQEHINQNIISNLTQYIKERMVSNNDRT